MDRFFIAACLLPGVLLSLLAQPVFAIELVGEKLELNGLISLSYDYMDSDVTQAEADISTEDNLLHEEFGYGGNPSRIDIEGVIPVSDDKSFFYEGSKSVAWDGSRDTILGTRSYAAGIRGVFGDISIGRQDTPFRTLGAQFAILRTTIAHRHAVIGATTDKGNRLNRRAEKSILWTQSAPMDDGDIQWKIIYSQDSLRTAGDIDNDMRAVWGAGINRRAANYTLALAHERWEKIYDSRINATRASIKRRFNSLELGLLFENINQDMVPGATDPATLDRNVYGFNVAYEASDTLTYGVQIFTAESYANTRDTGATMYSIGAEKEFSSSFSGSIAYTRTKNEANGAFQAIDGIRGDLGTLPGGMPTAYGVGLRYSF
ncbi:MAG: porin [Porticoccaceae bacterium]